jgi:hypothetical protein
LDVVISSFQQPLRTEKFSENNFQSRLEIMLLKGHKNQIPENAAAMRRIAGQLTGVPCWRPSMLVSFGFIPETSAKSLMTLDKSQQARAFETRVGSYLFNQHC